MKSWSDVNRKIREGGSVHLAGITLTAEGAFPDRQTLTWEEARQRSLDVLRRAEAERERAVSEEAALEAFWSDGEGVGDYGNDLH